LLQTSSEATTSMFR